LPGSKHKARPVHLRLRRESCSWFRIPSLPVMIAEIITRGFESGESGIPPMEIFRKASADPLRWFSTNITCRVPWDSGDAFQGITGRTIRDGCPACRSRLTRRGADGTGVSKLSRSPRVMLTRIRLPRGNSSDVGCGSKANAASSPGTRGFVLRTLRWMADLTWAL
jgi:hypothetical protein